MWVSSRRGVSGPTPHVPAVLCLGLSLRLAHPPGLPAGTHSSGHCAPLGPIPSCTKILTLSGTLLGARQGACCAVVQAVAPAWPVVAVSMARKQPAGQPQPRGDREEGGARKLSRRPGGGALHPISCLGSSESCQLRLCHPPLLGEPQAAPGASVSGYSWSLVRALFHPELFR